MLIFRAFAFVALGAAIAIVIVWIRVAPPWVIVEKSWAGYQVLQTFELVPNRIGSTPYELIKVGGSLLIGAKFGIPAILVTAYAAHGFLSGDKVGAAALRRRAVAALALIMLQFVVFHDQFHNLARFAWLLTLVLGLTIWWSGGGGVRTAFLLGPLLLSPVLLAFGSSSPLYLRAIMFTGVPLLALGVLASDFASVRRFMCGVMLVSVIGLNAAAFKHAKAKPYRLGAPFSQATETVVLNGEQFRTTPDIAATYRAFDAVRTKAAYKARAEDAVLIDMTGRTPLASLALDFRLPGSAWIPAGYEKSGALLDWFLERNSAEALKGAWLLIARPEEDGERRGLPLDVLNARLAPLGRRFPEDYTAVGSAPIAYVAMNAMLYAPSERGLE